MLTLTLPSALAVTGPKVINSMRSERVQFNALCVQNMCNVWRKNAMRALVDSHGDFKVNAVGLRTKNKQRVQWVVQFTFAAMA